MQLLWMFLATAVTALSVPAIRKVGIMDKPNSRKIHSVPTPKSGGIAIFLGFICSLLLWGGMHDTVWVVLLAAVSALTGLLDDIFEFNPLLKLALEAIPALIAVWLGWHFRILGSPFDQVVTVVWIVGYMNAFNLIDGMDGLSTSIALLQMCGLLLAAVLAGTSPLVIAIAIALIGACLGFLPFNWYPAKMFMGDSGSLFIGMIISVAGILFQRSLPETLAWSGAFVILGISLYPILDTVLSMYRRARHGVSILTPDRSHSYNLLADVHGFGHKQVVAMIAVFVVIAGGTTVLAFQTGLGAWLVAIPSLLCILFGGLLTHRKGLADVDKGTDR